MAQAQTSGDWLPRTLAGQVRVQLKRKNENYGQPSDIVLVTVIP